MSHCRIEITDVTNIVPGAAGAPSKGTGAYKKTKGSARVSDTGEIKCRHRRRKNFELIFEIGVTGYTFANPGFSFVVDSPQLGAPVNNKPTECTVPNRNYDASYKYTLHLIDNSGNAVDLDPKIINR